MIQNKYSAYICLCLLSLLFMAVDCDDGYEYPHAKVTFENKSKEDIYYVDFWEPFTVAEAFEKAPNYGQIVHILHKGEKDETLDVRDWGTWLDEHDKYGLYIMIFHKSTWDKYTKEELAEKNIYDKLLFFTYDELKAMDFKIEYTGTD